MIRPTNLVIFAAVALLGFGVFRAKHEVQALQEELVRVNKSIVAERDAIHVLKAEWSYLNQPQRLAEMSRRHLNLQPVSTAQLGSLQSVPTKPNAAPAPMVAEAPSAVAAKLPQVAGTLPIHKVRAEQ